jgi:hypothetical protein
MLVSSRRRIIGTGKQTFYYGVGLNRIPIGVIANSAFPDAGKSYLGNQRNKDYGTST